LIISKYFYSVTFQSKSKKSVTQYIVGICHGFDASKHLGYPEEDLRVFQVARILCQKPDKRELVNAQAATSDALFFFDIGHFLS